MRNAFALALLLCGGAAFGHASPPLDKAGEESLARARRIARPGLGLAPPSGDRDVGDVAVIADDDGTLAPLFDFDFIGAARKFYRTHADGYDAIVIFTDFEPRGLGGVVAYASPLRTEVEGIGDVFHNGHRPADYGRLFGSRRALDAFVVMNDIASYPEDPRAPFLGAFNTVGVLAQEFAHRWGIFVRAVGRDGAPAPSLLTSDEAHWSFFFHSCGSALDGNVILDRGDGSFETLDPAFGYGPFDLYLMGLLAPEEVGPSFVVESAHHFTPSTDAHGRDWDRNDFAVAGVTFQGEKREVRIDDLIAAEGPRRPAAGDAPARFRVAFALVVMQGAQPRAGSLEKVDRIRLAFEEHFRAATGGRGEVLTSLDRGPATARPLLVAVRPEVIRAGATVPLMIHTERVDPSAVVRVEGDGVRLEGLTPVLRGFRATLIAAPDAKSGPRRVRVIGPDGQGDSLPAITVDGGGLPPRALRLDPINARRGQSILFALSTQLAQKGARVEISGPGVALTPVGQDGLDLWFVVDVAADAPVGLRDVSVVNPDGQRDTLAGVLALWDEAATGLALASGAAPTGGACAGPEPVPGPRAKETPRLEASSCGGCGASGDGAWAALAALCALWSRRRSQRCPSTR